MVLVTDHVLRALAETNGNAPLTDNDLKISCQEHRVEERCKAT